MALADKIAELEAILDAGASGVAVDGVNVQYDLEEVRRRVAVLKRQNDASKRPRAAQVDMTNF